MDKTQNRKYMSMIKINNLCFHLLISIYIYIKSKEVTILHYHVSTVAENMDLLEGV